MDQETNAVGAQLSPSHSGGSGPATPTSDTSEITVVAAPGASGEPAGQQQQQHHEPQSELEEDPSAKRWVRFESTSPSDSSVRPDPVGEATSVAQIDVTVLQTEPKLTISPNKNLISSSLNGSTTIALNLCQNCRILSTIMPENECLPWLVPARFNAYKMPKTLVSDQLTLPVEDYVTSMELLTNDYRFRGYTMCYRRLISIWLALSLIILLAMLFSSRDGGFLVFLLVLLWMFLVAVGIFVCLCIKKQIHFIYFRTSDCMSKVMQLLSQYEMQAGSIPVTAAANNGQRAAAAATTTPDTGAADVENGLLVERARALVLKYSQSYVKATAKRSIRFPTSPLEGVSEFSPRHCTKSLCICQYLQKHHFERKEKKWYERFF